jgi:oligopeptide transport system substrate-binding protein
MKANKWLSTAVALTLVGSVAAGCATKKDDAQPTAPSASGDTSKPAAPAKPQEAKINIAAEPPVLDGSKLTAAIGYTMVNEFNAGLYRIDKDGKAQPDLAAGDPTVSADGLTWTFKLRDAVWSDGQPVKAQDFVYAWTRTLDPATQAQYSFMVAWIKGGDEILKAKTPDEVAKAKANFGAKALDDKTLEVKLVRPITFFKELMGFQVFFPQREDFVKQAGDKYGADADKVIGAGPFKLVKWDHGQSLEFVKNDKYWNAKDVKLDKFTVQIVKDTNTGQNLYETNAADVTEIKADQIKLYQGKPDIALKPELTNSYIMFQNKNKAFANAKIRQALTLAIDRQAFVDVTLANGSVPSTGLVPNGTMDGNGGDFRKTAGDTEPKFDVAKAKQLLADGLKEAGLSSLPQFKIMGDDTETAKKQLEFIISQWKTNLGVDAVADPVPHALRIERQSKHDFDTCLALWGADYNDPMTFLDMWETGGEFDEVDYSNPEYDKLIKGARESADPAARTKMLVDAEKILMQDMPVGPLYFRTRVYLRRPSLDGIFFPSYGVEWEVRWASVK